MAIPTGFKCIDWGGEVDEVQTRRGVHIFKTVSITWSRPKLWSKDEPVPIDRSEPPTNCVYALVREHHRSKKKNGIVYIGITKNLKTRFAKHAVAEKLRQMRGETFLSVGTVDFGDYWRNGGSKQATEQLEHLLIWALSPAFNDRKVDTLPGMGKHPTKPWHVKNLGFRFSGTMPQEIAYPWMLVKPGRDRSAKA